MNSARQMMSGDSRPPVPGHGQSGAALIVSLILLMVLTVLAISTMRGASLGLLMAGNVQYRENAFQLAQTGIEATLRRGDPGAAVGDCTAPVPAAPVTVPGLDGQYTTAVCDRGVSFTPGDSARLKTYNFEVTSIGSTEQRGARSRLVQGYALSGAIGR